ncbi:MAG: hypothetical protein RMY16_18265 [Nostoc sp. DedQUE12b]|uniref:hypothetical protein n=1 Tax=unclassified Nostoc TaxID=2593658 RepID=UPI002AD58AA7|nr:MULTISPECIES: hypothetical protein [unclassified Nostoc]MDZ7955803.1 hypothetical protein [Nostoc sp. DedQUE09]MDZ8087484.1 hypothetical protein [Nostoc sp. DedQUE12b]
MSNINNQTQDLYSIELVQDVDHEAAATVSGGALILSSLFNGRGTKRTYTGRNSSLGRLNNIASWFEVTGSRDWFAWTGRNFTGTRYRLRAGRAGDLSGRANNNFESARPA